MSESQWQTNTMISFNYQNTQSYTLDEWNLNNRKRLYSAVNLQRSADDLLAKSDQIRDIGVEVIKTNKEETDHRLQEKIKDIEYRRKEIFHNRKQVLEELDALETYKRRMVDTVASFKKNALNICRQCLDIRKERIGIDLVHDEVSQELQKELVVIKGTENLLEKTLEELQEQMRKLKAALYFIDRDLREKDENLLRNQENLNLRERHLSLKNVGALTCNQSNITLKEWEFQTIKNIKEATREMKLAKFVRNHVDSVLVEVAHDLNLQKNKTDDGFKKRIDETKEQKSKLEAYHAEIVEKADEMDQNVVRLEKSIAEKEGFLALAQTRINNQCKHSGMENTRDPVSLNLVKEIRDLNEIVTKLHQTLFEARASLRLMLKTQVQLEDDINIKINTLKIDEVDCMTLRQTVDFHTY